MVADERPEIYISVDVETAGANPSNYAMVSIGACLVDDVDEAFYIELRPDKDDVDDAALAISGLTIEHLREHGDPAGKAMLEFEQWVLKVAPADHRPVFVGFNAPFDWMFVNDYFHRYLGRNPFGPSALDIKAYYMGMTGESWAHTSMRYLAPRYLDGNPLSHNALDDARVQARLFDAILAEGLSRRQSDERQA